MTQAQFLQLFGPVIEAFGHNKFPGIVLERIQLKCHDLTGVEVKNLCDLIIDTCDHAPKTAKVAELANIIRARRNFTSRLHSGPDEEVIECGICFDLGIVRVVDRNDRLESLMLCECKEGHRQTTDLPRWSREWGQLYDRSRCPVDWFKPAIKYVNPDGSLKLDETIQSKRDYWKAKIEIAQGYWKQLRETALIAARERDVTPVEVTT